MIRSQQRHWTKTSTGGGVMGCTSLTNCCLASCTSLLVVFVHRETQFYALKWSTSIFISFIFRFWFLRSMTKRKSQSVYPVAHADISCPPSNQDDTSFQPSRKRTKHGETTCPPRLVRRSSSVSTTFNVCNDNNVVASLPPPVPAAITQIATTPQPCHSFRDIMSCDMDSRELPEESMEDNEEMRDICDNSRDIVSEGECIQTC